MTPQNLKLLPPIAFNYANILFSYFLSAFDRVCGILYDKIRACLSNAITFNVAVPFIPVDSLIVTF